ncbi:MAG: nuclease domain-containing protein [Gammaproteobacteria bacterium]
MLDTINKGEYGLIGPCKPEDLYKMHTFRDALVNVIGAFVLYPGKQTRFYPVQANGAYFMGVGALPLRPEMDGAVGVDDRLRLENLLRAFLQNA